MLKTILVDDEILALEGLADLLYLAGDFEIIRMFENPTDVLSQIENLDIDVMFLDIDMPFMNGIILAEQIIEKRPEVEVVFVTAYENYALSAIKTGATGYIVKPPDLESIQAIQKQISRRQKCLKIKHQDNAGLYISGLGKTTYMMNQQDMQLVFTTTKAEELFLLLLQQQGRPLTKDEIIDKLWEDFTKDKALNNFHVNCYYLRQSLNKIGMGGNFKRDRNGYMITTNNITYDIWEFEKLQFTPHTLTLNEAIVYERLYKGEFLVDRDFPWALSYREDYAKKYIEILNLILKVLKERNDLQRLVYFYQKAIDKDPLNERYYVGLLNALYQSKKHSEIRELFRRIQNEYKDWLGIAPPKPIMDFIQSIKAKSYYDN